MLVHDHLEEMTFWVKTVGALSPSRADLVVENTVPQSTGGDGTLAHLVKGSVPVEPVGSQNAVAIPTLREHELGQSTERREKMSLRDVHPASVRTPNWGVVLVAWE